MGMSTHVVGLVSDQILNL